MLLSMMILNYFRMKTVPYKIGKSLMNVNEKR